MIVPVRSYSLDSNRFLRHKRRPHLCELIFLRHKFSNDFIRRQRWRLDRLRRSPQPLHVVFGRRRHRPLFLRPRRNTNTPATPPPHSPTTRPCRYFSYLFRCAHGSPTQPANASTPTAYSTKPHSRLCLTSLRAFATISKLVDTTKKAARFFVTGLVQGVGFRFFAQSPKPNASASAATCAIAATAASKPTPSERPNSSRNFARASKKVRAFPASVPSPKSRRTSIRNTHPVSSQHQHFESDRSPQGWTT